MQPFVSLRSELSFTCRLLQAGLGAFAPPQREVGSRSPLLSERLEDCRYDWACAALTVGMGISSTLLLTRRKSLRTAVLNGLIAGGVGLGGALAWRSRRHAAEIVRRAARNISAVRDSHWLEHYPIDYA